MFRLFSNILKLLVEKTNFPYYSLSEWNYKLLNHNNFASFPKHLKKNQEKMILKLRRKGEEKLSF